MHLARSSKIANDAVYLDYEIRIPSRWACTLLVGMRRAALFVKNSWKIAANCSMSFSLLYMSSAPTDG